MNNEASEEDKKDFWSCPDLNDLIDNKLGVVDLHFRKQKKHFCKKGIFNLNRLFLEWVMKSN